MILFSHRWKSQPTCTGSSPGKSIDRSLATQVLIMEEKRRKREKKKSSSRTTERLLIKGDPHNSGEPQPQLMEVKLSICSLQGSAGNHRDGTPPPHGGHLQLAVSRGVGGGAVVAVTQRCHRSISLPSVNTEARTGTHVHSDPLQTHVMLTGRSSGCREGRVFTG